MEKSTLYRSVFIGALFILCPILSYSQIDSLQARITFLSNQEQQLRDSLRSISNELDSLNTLLSRLHLQSNGTILNTKIAGSLYSNPDAFSRSITRIGANQPVLVLDTDNDFVHVQYREFEGYIPLSRLEDAHKIHQNQAIINQIDEIKKDTRYVNALTANIRSEPSTDSSILMIVNQGHNVYVQEELDSWVKIRYLESTRPPLIDTYTGWTIDTIDSFYKTGWINKSLITTEYVRLIPVAELRRILFINSTNLSETHRDDIKNGKVRIGMTREMVVASWGEPLDINRTVTAAITSEQWVYGRIPNQKYIYFENGKMTAFQD